MGAEDDKEEAEGHSSSSSPLKPKAIFPVPLSQEEHNDDDIRALAAQLAPALREADQTLLMAMPQTNDVAEDNDDEGHDLDDLDEEERNLKASEAMLREELALALDFDAFLRQQHGESDDEEEEEEEEEQAFISPHAGGHQAPNLVSEPYVDEIAMEEDKFASPSATSSTEEEPSTPLTPNTSTVTEYWTPSEDTQLAPTSAPRATPTVSARLDEHMEKLRLHREGASCWYALDLTSRLIRRPCHTSVVQEYCLSIPDVKLRQLYIGLREKSNIATLLPVRTVTMRIRPDVLCGAVMEGVHNALGEDAEIEKRQGGHLQAVIQPGFFADIQLVTSKTQECVRKVIVRVFPCGDQPLQLPQKNVSPEDEFFDAIQSDNETDWQLNPNVILRESSALIQRMESPRKNIRLRRHTAQDLSSYLLGNYQPCPSVLQGGVTFPSLNSDDFSVIEASWPLIERIWEEIDTRDLAYSTLHEARFGAFPALQTLDSHYCAQIRRVARDIMVTELVHSAKQLEDYARESEYACANMISMLQPTFDAYSVKEPPLPEPIPLADYNLDFTPPQETCPPWGLLVQHALVEIPAWNDVAPDGTDAENAQKSYLLASKAVNIVFKAFSVQFDEERTARLHRKNAQVMDRLEKMKNHEYELIKRLSCCLTNKANRAADDFHAKTSLREVPLLKWNIVASAGAGTVAVTKGHIMFVTQRVPVVGSITVKYFSLDTIELEVIETPPSLLNPFPTSVAVIDTHTREQVYNFKLSSGGIRFKSLINRLQFHNAD